MSPTVYVSIYIIGIPFRFILPTDASRGARAIAAEALSVAEDLSVVEAPNATW